MVCEIIGLLKRALQPGKTRLVWIETPANPLWSITDISTFCDIAHAGGAAVAVDSTVATPVLTRPLALGADITDINIQEPSLEDVFLGYAGV